MKELNQLSVTPLEEKKWKLTKSWKILVDSNKITIPKGFTFDFATVPRLFWIFASPATGKYRKPALVHDWMYATKYKTKSYADNVFLRNMTYYGVGWLKRYLMYIAVVIFGRGNYDN